MSIKSQHIENKVYKFIHHKDEFIQTNIEDRSFSNEWLKIHKDGKIELKAKKKGYAWDGCSPKKNFLDLTFGTPDGMLLYRTEKPITYYASMFHDLIYQFKEEVPIARKEADKIFYELLKKENFFWSKVYYIAVRVFGWIYGSWKTKESQKNVKISEVSW